METKACRVRGRPRSRPPWRIGGFAAVLVGLVAFAAGCSGPGGSSIPGYVNGTPGSPVAFAQCMRAHGVPNFPDPPSNGDQWNLTGVNQNSTQFRNAVAICGSSGPGADPAQQEAQGMAKALAFSRCMRAHGEHNYPDPVASGSNISTHVSTGSGDDRNSPAYQAALRACRSLLSADDSGTGNTGGTA